jgi:AcrR family transcriptional regulator
MPLDSDKKRCILDAAATLFAHFGFKKTSIDQVAAGAGVGKGTVYMAAENKQELFYQVVHREIRGFVARCSAMIDPRKPANELLTQSSLHVYQYIQDNPLVRDLLLGNLEEVLPLWTEQLQDLRTIGRAHIVEVLHIGIKQGVFRDDMDVPIVARILQDMQVMGVLLAYREKRPPEEQIALGMVGLDVILKGLEART